MYNNVVENWKNIARVPLPPRYWYRDKKYRSGTVVPSVPPIPTTVISQLPGNSIHQLNKYLDTTEILNDDSMIFWHHNRRTFDKLYLPALQALSVPASSSAVERVFSQGGLILRPHRSRLNDRLFSDLKMQQRNILKQHICLLHAIKKHWYLCSFQFRDLFICIWFLFVRPTQYTCTLYPTLYLYGTWTIGTCACTRTWELGTCYITDSGV
jgi:hypothetical protein